MTALRFTLADLERARRDIATLWACFVPVASHLHASLDDAGLSDAVRAARGTAIDEAWAKAREIWNRYPNVLWLDYDHDEPLSVVDRWQRSLEEWSRS